MASSRVIDRDRGWKRIIKALGDDDFEVDVGFFDERNATVGFFNEFGTREVPERPFMRTAFDRNLPQMTALFKKLLGNVADGKTSKRAAGLVLGKKMKKLITDSISSWSTPPNASSTIERKGFNRPLVDTGQMLKSVTFKLKKRKVIT